MALCLIGSDDEIIKLYIELNTLLSKWLENLGSVSRHMWVRDLHLASEVGLETLPRTLREVGFEVVPFGRKRKRDSAKRNNKEILRLMQE